MKKALLFTAIAATAATFSGSTLASGALSFDIDQINADVPQGKIHGYVMGNALYNSVDGTNSARDFGGTYGALGSTRDTNGDLFNTTINCTGDPNANPPNYNSEVPDALMTLYGYAWVGTGALTQKEGNQLQCGVDIGDHGHITGGYSIFPATSVLSLGNITVVNLYDAPRATINFVSAGTQCPTDVPTLLALAEDAYQLVTTNTYGGGVDTVESDMNPPPPAGCNVFGVGEISFGQCDPARDDLDCVNGALAKAVPVPAFAAAALGLGLAGITYLTSRRRRVAK